MDYRPFEVMHLVARDLVCHRDSVPVFEPVSFEAKNAGLIWLQGENGAGKTTLLRMLAGFTRSSAGSLELNERPFHQWQQAMGCAPLYLGHSLGLNPNLTALENLNGLIGLSHGLGWQADIGKLTNVLGQAGLWGKEDQPVRLLSAGQKKRLVLAQLLWKPVAPIWILDEPFSAMDVQAVQALIRVMARHLSAGGIILFSSHDTMQALACLNPSRVEIKSAQADTRQVHER